MNKEIDEALEDLEQLAEMADNCWVSCDVHKWKNTIKQALLKAQENSKYKQLEEQIGCPLEVRCKVVCDSHIYDENGIKYEVVYVYEDHFDCEDPFDNDMGYTKLCAFDWEDYKKEFWLKEDKSE